MSLYQVQQCLFDYLRAVEKAGPGSTRPLINIEVYDLTDEETRALTEGRLPMVPIVLNCTTPPLMTLRHCYEFGIALGKAIRSYDGLERIAIVGAGGPSHFVGEPRVGDIEEEFDRWFMQQLEGNNLDELLDMPNDELIEAGNGTGEVRAWVAIAGAMRDYKGIALSYQPIYEWINGMGVVRCDTPSVTAPV